MTDKKHHVLKLYSWVTNAKLGATNFIQSVGPDGTDAAYPQDGINLLYGRRFGQESLYLALRDAKAQGEILTPVELRLSAIRPGSANHWFDRVEGKNVVDLHRLNPDLEAFVAECWKRYLAKDGFSTRGVSWDRREFIGQFPSYIDRLHREEPFQNVDALIWRTRQNRKVISRVTLYNPSRILSMRAISAEHLQVALPQIQAEAA